MEFFRSKWIALIALIGFLPSCAVKSHQFADAVHKGNVPYAKTYFEPGYARMKFSLAKAPGQYSLPIQYAILQQNKPMAEFLIKNGSPTMLEGNNLTYYCAYYGQREMANYFASIGQGSSSDIYRAHSDLARKREERRKRDYKTALIGLAILAVLIGVSSKSSRSASQSQDDAARENAARARAEQEKQARQEEERKREEEWRLLDEARGW